MSIICNLCIFNGFSGIFHFNGIFSGTCFNVITCIFKRICPSFKDFNGFFTVSAFKSTQGRIIILNNFIICISFAVKFLVSFFKRFIHISLSLNVIYLFNPGIKIIYISIDFSGIHKRKIFVINFVQISGSNSVNIINAVKRISHIFRKIFNKAFLLIHFL